MSDIDEDFLVRSRHVLLHLFGLTSLIDAIVYHPYTNEEINQFNLITSSIFYAFVFVCNLWMNTSSVSEYEIFFFGALAAVILSIASLSFYTYSYEQLFQTNIFKRISKGGSENQCLSDFNILHYLEEWVSIAQNSSNFKVMKYKCFRIQLYHEQSCSLKECPCKLVKQNLNAKNHTHLHRDPLATHQKVVGGGSSTHEHSSKSDNQIRTANQTGNSATATATQTTTIASTPNSAIIENQEVDLKVIYEIVDTVFRWVLSQRRIVESGSNFEIISLKYITFMVKYLKNYVRAAFELNTIISQRNTRKEKTSIYFQLISAILNEDLSIVISRMNEQYLKQKHKEELTFKHVTDSERMCEEIMPYCVEVLKQKSAMWTEMQKGFASMNGYQTKAMRLSRSIDKTRTEYFRRLQELQKNRDFSYCLMMKKMNAIFYLFVLNDCSRAYQFEQDVSDLKKRDAFLEEDILNNENLLKKNIVSLTVSISRDTLGKIVSKKDTKSAQFFGYSKQEFQKISNINEIIPKFISIHHNTIISNFIKRGRSNLIKSTIPSFARDSQGYVMPVQINIDFSQQSQSSNEFLMQGTILKVNKAADFILFDRTGRILGLSQNLTQQLLVDSKILDSLPMAEATIKNMHAFTLIPRIIKNLMQKKKEILAMVKRTDFRQETIINDEKSAIHFDCQLLSSAKTFASFLSKPVPNQQQQNSPIPMELIRALMKTDRSNKSSMESNLASMNVLDVLSRESYSKFSTFKRSRRSSFFNRDKVSEDSKSSNRQGKQRFTQLTRIAKQKRINNITAEARLEQFRLSFRYTLSAHSLPNVNTTQKKSFDSLYFCVRIRDSLLQKASQTGNSSASNRNLSSPKMKSKKESFAEQISQILNSVTCIPAIIAKSNAIKQISSRIPKHFITSITKQAEHPIHGKPSRISNISDQRSPTSSKRKSKKSFKPRKFDEINSDYQSSGRSAFNENQSEFDSNSQLSDDSSDFSDAYSDISQNASGKTSEYYHQLKALDQPVDSTEFDSMLNSYRLDSSHLKKIDSNYQLKRVITSKLNSNKLIQALELAISQVLFEVAEANNQQNSANDYIVNGESILAADSINENISLNFATFRGGAQPINSHTREIPSPMLMPAQQPISGMRGFREEEKDGEFNLLEKHSRLTNIKNKGNIPQLKQNEILNTALDTMPNHTTTVDATEEEMLASSLKFNHHTENNITVTDRLMDENHSTILGRNLSNAPTQRPFIGRIRQQKQESQIKTEHTTEEFDFLQREQLMAAKLLENQTHPNKKGILKSQRQNMKNDSSGSKNSGDGNDFQGRKSQVTHKAFLVNVVKQADAMFDPKLLDQSSVRSSTKSTGSNGNDFLREIIATRKEPSSTQHISALMIIFSLVFIGLNITKLLIIRNDMEYFSSNVDVLRLPRKLLQVYVKSIYGFYLQIQVEGGYFKDTTSNAYNTLGELYIKNSTLEYNQMIEQNQVLLIQSMQSLQSYINKQTDTFNYCQDFELSPSQIDIALIFEIPIYYLLGIQKDQSDSIQARSFITLRSNLYMLKNYVLTLADYLINSVLTTADNLILKFTIICIIAIGMLIIITIASFSIASKLNLYEEKILMVVSRISFEHSEVEKFKLEVYQKLLSTDTYDWLKFQYLEFAGIQFKHFQKSKADQKKKQMQKTIEKEELRLRSGFGGLGDTTRKNLPSFQNLGNSIAMMQQNSSGGNSTDRSQTQGHGQNYLLQSKIQRQKLSVFTRIRSFLILMSIGIAYFLVVIIYLNSNKSALKMPVQINRSANFLHANTVAYIISSELLAYDSYLTVLKWPKYALNDLEFFGTSMDESLDVVVDQLQSLQDYIYGENPYSEETLQQLKDLIEGNVCTYLVTYPCTSSSSSDDSVQSNIKGIRQIVTDLREMRTTFQNVLTPDPTPLEDMLVYLNSKERIETFVRGFSRSDEVLDILGQQTRLSIGTVSNNIQSFLERYLLICGSIIAAIIIAAFIYTWNQITTSIKLMNIFLTQIPEEKLQEDVTLQMLKSLRQM